MKHTSKFTKAFLYTSFFTLTCWTLAFGLSTLANERPFPNALLAKLETKLNESNKQFDETKRASASGIKTISVESGSTDLEIVSVDSTEFVAHLAGMGGQDTNFDMTPENGELKIKIVGSGYTHFSFSSVTTSNNVVVTGTSLHLKLQVPKAFAGAIGLTVKSADVTLNGIATDRLTILSGSGDVTLNELSSKLLTVYTGSGDIEVEKLNAAVLDFKTGSGDVEASDLQSETASVKTGSGEVAFHLGDLSKWTANVRVGSGDLETSLPGATKSEHELKVGSGRATLQIQTGSGDVKLEL